MASLRRRKRRGGAKNVMIAGKVFSTGREIKK
jgi:hypothetical protein